MEPSNWFKGTEKSIVQLSQEQQAAFFLECDKNCVNSSTLTIYRKLYEDANEDMDAFFQMANELPGVKGESLKKAVSIILPSWNAPAICARKVCYYAFTLRTLASERHLFHAKPLKDLKFNFTLCHFILQGGQNCKTIIEVI